MGTWSENWKATHAGYVHKTKGVKSVMEHRNVEKGEIYCVAMNGGGFEVRHYEGETLKANVAYPSGVKALMAYRGLRDKLVPNRKSAKTEMKTTPKKAAPKKAKAKRKAAKPKAEVVKVEVKK